MKTTKKKKSFVYLLAMLVVLLGVTIYYFLIIRRTKNSSTVTPPTSSTETFKKAVDAGIKEEEQMINLLTSVARMIRPDIVNRVVISAGPRSVTFNKKDVRLCLYDVNRKMYSFKILMYVLLHELAHVITETMSGYGDVPHDAKFLDSIDLLVRQAAQNGICVDKSAVPESYCLS